MPRIKGAQSGESQVFSNPGCTRSERVWRGRSQVIDTDTEEVCSYTPAVSEHLEK